MLLTHSILLLHHTCKKTCAIFTLILSGVQGESSEFLWYILNNKPIVKKIPIKPVNIIRIYDTVQKKIASQAIYGLSEFALRLPNSNPLNGFCSQIFRGKESKISLEEGKWFQGTAEQFGLGAFQLQPFYSFNPFLYAYPLSCVDRVI